MAGYRTFNATDKPMWITLYSEPGGMKVDRGEVAPRSWRDWEGSQYTRLSYYKVRAEWPMHGRKFDTSTTNRLDGPHSLKPHVLFGGKQGVWWDVPFWRTVNTLDRSIWVTIYSFNGGKALDWGEVEPHGYRDWRAGEYGPGTFYRLRAESGPKEARFDVETRGLFNRDWGLATFARDTAGAYEWKIPGDPWHDEVPLGLSSHFVLEAARQTG